MKETERGEAQSAEAMAKGRSGGIEEVEEGQGEMRKAEGLEGREHLSGGLAGKKRPGQKPKNGLTMRSRRCTHRPRGVVCASSRTARGAGQTP